jgi:hypothetical protein
MLRFSPKDGEDVDESLHPTSPGLGFRVCIRTDRRQDSCQAPSRAPDGGTNYRVDGVDLPALPGMPLTGKSRIEWTRTFEDGSTVTVHLEANLARGSAGHMYRERRCFVPANSNEEPRLNEIMLFDPDARTKTTCTLATKTCVVIDYYPRREFALQNPG